MNLGDLRGEYRIRTDDLAAPFLWTDIAIDGYANAAVVEACERAYLIEDDTTPEVCDITIVAGTASYALHPSIIKVRTVLLNGSFLPGVSREELSERYPDGWRTLTGTPSAFIDPQAKFLTLFRNPTVAGTVHLSVYRRPLVVMENDDDEPEIPAHLHLQLVDWMTHLGYNKKDRDTYDPKAAAEGEAAFIAAFGQRPDANVRRMQRARRTNQVVFNPSW